MLIYLYLLSTVSTTLDFNMFSGSQLASLIKWINAVLPYVNLPLETSEEELRAWLRDGSLLCNILDKLVPGSLEVIRLSFMVLYTYTLLSFFFR